MKNQPNNIAVVIPNWNGKEDLAACLDSLSHQSMPHKVIVVDNGSVDGSVDFVRNNYQKVDLIALPRNTGFSGGVNTGIQRALEQGFSYIALLNNDAVVDRFWLEELFILAEEKTKSAIVTGKILKSNKKTIDTTGDQYGVWGLPHPRGRDEIDNGQYDQAEEVTAACGGASLYRASALSSIGIFDERFFAYYEDVDISLRARLLGWSVWYTPKAITYHKVGATSSRLGDFTRYQSLKNYMLLYLNNMPGLLFWKHLPKYLFGVLWISLSNLKIGKVTLVLKAHFYVFTHFIGILLTRYRTMRRKVLSNKKFEQLLFKENLFLKRRRSK